MVKARANLLSKILRGTQKMRKTGSKTKWQRVDLNHRPKAYESSALPLSYAAMRYYCSYK